MSLWLLGLAGITYFLGIAFATTSVLRGQSKLGRLAFSAVAIGASLHWIEVIRRAVVLGGNPIVDVSGFLLVLGGGIALLCLTVWWRLRLDAIALVLTPLSLVTALLALKLSNHVLEDPPGGLLALHVTLVTIGLVLLGLAFAMAVFYVLQDFSLKSRRNLSMLNVLPALDRCDQIGFTALIFGFILFTIGIFGGIVLQIDASATLVTSDSKQALSLIAWTIFAVVALLRMAAGFRGRRSAALVIVGFIAGLSTVIGMVV